MRRSCLCTLLVFLIAGQITNANNEDPNDPNEMLQIKLGADVKDPNDLKKLLQLKWDAIICVLQKKDIDQKAKEKQFNKIITPIFDLPLMAKLALGSKHWPKSNLPQREKYTQLFTERLKSSYWETIKLYKDEKVLFKPAVQNKKNKKTVYIPVELISKDDKTTILYKFRKVDLPQVNWKIYDVEIQGVSILLTYRAQFDDILSNGNVKDLLSQLEKPPEP